MAVKLATPGVYIEEKNAFPNSIVAVGTAIPAFIGYTERTSRDGQSLINRPVRITSLTDFVNTFGGAFHTTFKLQDAVKGQEAHFEVAGKPYHVVPENPARFILYDSMRLFFSNGGATCYVISAGGYYAEGSAPEATSTASEGEEEAVTTPNSGGKPKVNAISKKALSTAMQLLIAEDEPTMVVIPEAVMLEQDDCFALQQEMLQLCGYKMQDRFALLDVYNGYQPRTYDDQDVITRFREGVGNNFLSYGASYYPWVYTSIVQNDEVSFKNISNLDVLADVLTKEATETIQDRKRADETKQEINKLKDTNPNVENLNQTLKVICPSFKQVLDKVKMQLNVLPPAAGMAGIYTAIDNTRGVWKAPANVGYSAVVTPVVRLTQDDQEDLNVTVTGKSVNAIRSFIGEGTVVWGARTLDGNSQDWRYINVRRTLLFIEKSVKLAAKKYVFEPNTSSTWSLMRSMIGTFLNNLWNQGALVGLTPDQAYEVNVGLGSTMTPNDILDGVMRIIVKVAVSRPAEFIVITFQQKMQES
jgi:hypothetical protein